MRSAPWSDPIELITAFKKGDQSAYRHIYLTHNRSIALKALDITGNTQEAEDVVTETFVRLWEKRATLDTGTNLRAWLLKVATNLSLDKLKASKRHDAAEEEVGYLIQQEEDARYWEALSLRSELVDRVFSFMNEMPDAMREVFRLYFVEGLKSSDIATRLGISMDTVRVQKHRALQLIREAFNGKDPPFRL